MEEGTQSAVSYPTSDSCEGDSSVRKDAGSPGGEMDTVIMGKCGDKFEAQDITTKNHSNSIPNGCINHKIDCDENELVRKIGQVRLENGSTKVDSENQDTEPLNNESQKLQTCDIQDSESESDKLQKDKISADETDREVNSADNVCSTKTSNVEKDSVKDCSCKEETNEKTSQQEDILENAVVKAESDVEYVVYESELQMPDIMRLITKDLSEPYSIYTYRYFIHNWPKLCFLAMCEGTYVGAIVCKLDMHKKMVRRGYIAMLAVDQNYRRKGIGSQLVLKAIQAMVADDCDEVVLETEISNKAALHLYENLGFVRDKRLFRYYLNGVDALRLKLWLR